MNKLTVYDPTVAEHGHDRMTDQMIAAVNRHHQDAQKERAVLNTVAALQRAQAAQIAQHTRREVELYAKNRKLERKIKRRAGWGAISREFVLLGGSWIAYKAMGAGVIKFNLSFPLALAGALYGGWLLRCLWQEIMK